MAENAKAGIKSGASSPTLVEPRALFHSYRSLAAQAAALSLEPITKVIYLFYFPECKTLAMPEEERGSTHS